LRISRSMRGLKGCPAQGKEEGGKYNGKPRWHCPAAGERRHCLEREKEKSDAFIPHGKKKGQKTRFVFLRVRRTASWCSWGGKKQSILATRIRPCGAGGGRSRRLQAWLLFSRTAVVLERGGINDAIVLVETSRERKEKVLVASRKRTKRIIFAQERRPCSAGMEGGLRAGKGGGNLYGQSPATWGRRSFSFNIKKTQATQGGTTIKEAS